MNRFRTRTMLRSAAAAILLGLSACSGGGGGGSGPSFSLFSVDPAESLDLNGGDDVIIYGKNFLAARVAQVLFGDGNPGFNLQVLDDERIQVTAPPSPTGQPVIVTVEVVTLELGTKGIFGGYRYVGSGGNTGPPQPQTIFPTTYTATGAQQFTIQGTSLGPAGGTVTVDFAGIGAVIADVNADGTLVVGRSPVAPAVPPAGPISVTVDNNGDMGVVPTQVNYVYAGPIAIPVPNQEGADNASRPVRVSDTLAVMATAGGDFAWFNGNDDILLVSGPPNTVQVRSVLAGQAASLRNLDPNNSIPVVLDSDTICVYSPGPLPTLGDEIILLITNLGAATPTVTALPTINCAPMPLGRISANRVGFIQRGTGTGGQDQLQIFNIVNGAFAGSLAAAIDVNVTDPNGVSGRRNRSIPSSPDGDSVFVWSSGLNGTFSDNDDQLYRHRVSSGQTAIAATRFLLTRPQALSASRVVAISTGTAAAPVDPDDQLAIFDVAGNVFSINHVDLNSFADVSAPRPLVALGSDGLVLIGGGMDRFANTADDVLAVFTDDGSGGYNRSDAAFGRRPSLVTLGSGDVVAFGRGADGVANTADDRAVRILADGSALQDFTGAPGWSLSTGPLADVTRTFVIGDGLDLIPASGDEELLVYQSASLGRGADTATLPMSAGIASPILSSAVSPIVFVPVGPGWGVVQSPGRNGLWLGADDYIVVVEY